MISRGQGWRSASCALTLAVLITPGGAANPAPRSQAVSNATADVTACEFYRWYLGKLAQEKEADTDPVGYARFVTAPLRARIKKELNNDSGEERDYFLKTQDFMEDWPSHVTATPATVHGAAASTIVTLGINKQNLQRLAVTLVKEAGLWRVSRVTEVPSKS